MWSSLLLTWWCAVPIFGPPDENPWDVLHRVFYSREFANGEVYNHESALDGPPFVTWARFYNDETFYNSVLEKLDQFLQQLPSEVEQQPAVRRAILLRDLWPVFDAQTHSYLTKSDEAVDRQMELRKRLARIMHRLELTETEAEQLPDNFKIAVAGRVFPAVFDEQSPQSAFLPSDLFDESGPWVPIGQGSSVPGASGHFDGRVRSIFVPFIRVSSERQDSLDCLTRFRQSPTTTTIPPGTLLALVRGMVLPTSSGAMIATPVVESLQLIVVDPPNDHHYKFVLDRAELIAGRAGLRALSDLDAADAFGFEAHHLTPHRPAYDSDGEKLLAGRWERGRLAVSPLSLCVACHGPTVGQRLFANGNGLNGRASPTTWDAQARLILSLREKDESWKTYLSLRD